MVAVGDPQPAPDAPSHGATTRCQSWMRRAVIAAMVLFALRGLAIVLGEFAPDHPWVVGVERLLGGLGAIAILAYLACWAYSAPGVDGRALLVWTAMMVVVCGRPYHVGLSAPWERMADVTRLILITSLSFLSLMHLARAMATSTQRDIGAKLGIRRAGR